MVKIVLEPAGNGVIKRVIDDNHGGGREQWTSTEVYEDSKQDDDRHQYIMRFFFDLCEDLGMNLGNKFSKDVITIRTEWGSHFEPSEKELESKIKELEAELQSLKECKKS
jgi:hypothetical protein